MKVEVTGGLPFGTSAKDLALAIVGQLGAAGANGHMIEFCGDAIRGLDMAGRMTLSNMAVEMGARAGLIAPDETTFDYVRGRDLRADRRGARPRDRLVAHAGRPTPARHTTGRDDRCDAAIAPMVTWGTNPEAVVPITGSVPDPDDEPDRSARRSAAACSTTWGSCRASG